MVFYSHIKRDEKTDEIIDKQELRIHIKNVAELMTSEIDSFNLNFPIEKKILHDITFLTGIAHDFGKYTTFFQNKLLKKIKSKESEHGLISAIFGFYIINEYLQNMFLNQIKIKYIPLIIFQSIRHHHGNLHSIFNDVQLDKKRNTLISQKKNLKQNWQIIKNELNNLLNSYEINLDHFLGLFDKTTDKDYVYKYEFDIAKLEYFYSFGANINDDIKFYYFVLNQFLYSLLISNDKIEASKIKKFERKHIDNKLIDNYKKSVFKINKKYIDKVKIKKTNNLELNEIREKIYHETLKNLETIDLNKNKIFTLTAPTGTGKTLTSLAAGFFIRNKLNNNARIIYSLPFTSIIEQNFDVIEGILNNSIDDFIENKNQYLLKHHYFSDINYKVEGENKNVEDSLLYIENWDSEIIVTTFIQLFYTLIGYENRSLKKFYHLANSIVILDEVQNIPVKYWQVINTILILISKFLNTYIILLTATKPLIFNSNEAIELLEDHEKYFKAKRLNRTKIIQINVNTLEKLKENIIDKKNKFNSILIILNTIQSTLDFFKLIENDESFNNYHKIYLSTNITPFERRNRIISVKNMLKDKKRVIIITTQLVEAGVDIDVDLIFRDMAPLDSIIQAAGRANRNNNKVQSTIYITNLIYDKNRSYSELIYDHISLNEGTKTIVKKNKEYDEENYLELINKYYEIMSIKKSKLTSFKITNSIKEFYYYDKGFDKTKRIPISEFKLIEELHHYVSLFIEINTNAKHLWDEFIKLKEIKNNIIRKKYFYKIKAEFYQYIISLPEKCINSLCEPIMNNLYFLSYEKVKKNDIYDMDIDKGIGFNRDIEYWIF